MEKTQRINDQIRISPVRLIDQNGTMIGIVPTEQALTMATEVGLDLVEVSPNDRPPVCRIMDFGKFKYEQKKRQSQSAKTHQTQIKEIRLRPKTGEHDIDFKVRRAREFLDHKDKVKINVIFRGREHAHHERGLEMLKEIIVKLEDVAKVEKPPSMDSGRSVSTILAPK